MGERANGRPQAASPVPDPQYQSLRKTSRAHSPGNSSGLPSVVCGLQKVSNTEQTQQGGINRMENLTQSIGLVAMVSVLTAGLTIAIGSIGTALGQGRAVSQALQSIAQQPDEANTITRTLFVGLAMIESTAIYRLVISIILIFVNPFLNYFVALMNAAAAGG